jgi:hypothetical protein
VHEPDHDRDIAMKEIDRLRDNPETMQRLIERPARGEDADPAKRPHHQAHRTRGEDDDKEHACRP